MTGFGIPLSGKEISDAILQSDKTGYFDTLADFKSSTKIYDRVHIKGYYSADDGAFGSLNHYLLPNDGTVYTEQGGVQFQTASGRWYKLSYGNELNLRWVGAKGDGVTSDTAAINTALSVGGKIVGNNEDIYLVGSLNIKSNTYIDLKGASIIRNTVELPGNVDLWHTDSWMLYITNSKLENITIENGVIDNKHTQDSTVYRGFMGLNLSSRITNLQLRNIVFSDDFAGVYASNLCLYPSILNSDVYACTINNPNTIPVGTPTLDTKAVPYVLIGGSYCVNFNMRRCSADGVFSLAVFSAPPASRPNDIPKNNTADHCTADNTIDTSIYYYGDNNVINSCKISNPGKDGLKINTSPFHSSHNNIIKYNIIKGAPAQHQADGGSMIVMVGDTNTCKHNEVIIDNPSNPHGNSLFCISVDGKDSKVIYNTLYGGVPNTSGVFVYDFINNISERTGVVVDNNTIDCQAIDVAVSKSHKRFSISNNYIYTNVTGIYISIPTVQPDVMIPVFCSIDNNKFISKNPTAKHILNYNVDRVSFNGNKFIGSAQRDMQPANNNGALLGIGNMSEGLNDPVYYAYESTLRGGKYLAVPTKGTFKKGEIISGRDFGFRCLTSGTMGSITGVTASTTIGSPTIILNTAFTVFEGNYITISGETGIFTVIYVASDGVTITLSTNTTKTNAAATVNYSNATWSASSEFYA